MNLEEMNTSSIIHLKGSNFAYFTIHLWEPLNNTIWFNVENGNLTMFGFSSIVSRRRTKESLEEKIFKKKKELEGAADETIYYC